MFDTNNKLVVVLFVLGGLVLFVVGGIMSELIPNIF